MDRFSSASRDERFHDRFAAQENFPYKYEPCRGFGNLPGRRLAIPLDDQGL